MSDAIRERVAAVRDRVAQAAHASGRDVESIKVMAVTKGHDTRAVWALIQEGFTLFGENRVQEAKEKYASISVPITLHLIGHLQTNKVKLALGIFQVIQSLDNPRLADALQRRSVGTVSVMIEVNAGREPQKHGLWPEDVPRFLDDLCQWPSLSAVGLMAVLPEQGPTATLMAQTAELWRRCREEKWPWAPLQELSMGMSGDFEEAIRQGSTMVRLGTALLGLRQSSSHTGASEMNQGSAES